VEATTEIRTKAVVFSEEGIRSAKGIGELYSIPERTVRRWAQHHRENPETGLKPKKTGPKRSRRAIPVSLEQRIIRSKGKYPAWGARRIKHHFNLPCSWRTVHRILKKHGLLFFFRNPGRSGGYKSGYGWWKSFLKRSTCVYERRSFHTPEGTYQPGNNNPGTCQPACDHPSSEGSRKIILENPVNFEPEEYAADSRPSHGSKCVKGMRNAASIPAHDYKPLDLPERTLSYVCGRRDSRYVEKLRWNGERGLRSSRMPGRSASSATAKRWRGQGHPLRHCLV